MTAMTPSTTPADADLTRALIDHAAELHAKAGASDILLYADGFDGFSELKEMLASFQGINFVLATRNEATAITVSESTGTVTVFQNGRVFVEIEAPRRIGAKTRKTNAFFADTLAEKGQTVPCDEASGQPGGAV